MKLLAVLALFGAVLICCEAKKKCGFAVKSCAAGFSSPCPKNAICPKDAKINRKASGCCCDLPVTTKPPGKCGPNEALSDVSNACTHCSLLFINAACKPGRLTTPACNCISGYRYDHNMKCILEKSCKPQCGANQVYSPCGGRCQATCETPNPACPKGCFKGCICKAGFVKKGAECVAKTQCGGTCGPNQELSLMSDGCTTCAALFVNVACKPARFLTPQCVCKSGFRRDLNKNCIKSADCKPPQCKANMVYSECGSRCPATCDDPKPTCSERPGQPGRPGQCLKGCVCKPGFIYNSNRVCVAKAQCGGTCGPNQEMSLMSDSCTTCAMLFTNAQCKPARYKTPRCACKSGFRRDHNQNCIKAADCKPQCGANMAYSACGGRCQATCDTPKPVCPKGCFKGCVCKAGFVKKGAQCVPKAQCGGTCGPNQELSLMSDGCTSCAALFVNVACKPARFSSPQCVCKSGFRRDLNKNCIKSADCKPPQCKANMVYSECGSRCPATCDDPKPTCSERPGQPGRPGQCLKGCVCKPGFLYDSNRVCVSKAQCGGTCGPNQELSLISDSCTSCAMLFTDDRCRPVRYTTPQCACKDGFRRDHNKNCIKWEDCKPKCKANMVYSPCGGTCKGTCADPKITCRPGCWRGCVCKPGFFYNSNRVCVSKAECDLCKGDEVYSACGAGCQATCEKRNPICTKICKKGCVCQNGFVRKQGKCVHVTDCPRACDANSVWTETAGDCDTCYWFSQNIKTKAQCPSKRIRPNCECKPGFYRNQMGECVTGAACACSVLEAYKECGCEKTCANASAKLACTKAACKKGCFCNDAIGFVRHNGACISSQTCPKP